MKFDLVVTENCSACKRAEELLTNYFFNKKSISFNVSLQRNFEKSIAIVPALLMEGKLFAYGDIDLQKLDDRINGALN
jgi:predicted thioredoxin/glutaredoxin